MLLSIYYLLFTAEYTPDSENVSLHSPPPENPSMVPSGDFSGWAFQVPSGERTLWLIKYGIVVYWGRIQRSRQKGPLQVNYRMENPSHPIISYVGPGAERHLDNNCGEALHLWTTQFDSPSPEYTLLYSRYMVHWPDWPLL